MLYSATHADTNISTPVLLRAVAGASGWSLGFVFLVMLSVVNYQWFARWQMYIYGGSLLLLVLTLVIGSGRARRWARTAGSSCRSSGCRPSELAKFLLILSLGGGAGRGGGAAAPVPLRDPLRRLRARARQRSSSCSPTWGPRWSSWPSCIVMLVVWGIRLPHLGVLAGAGDLGAVVVVLRILPSAFGVHLLKDYQLQRLTVFLDPEKDPTGVGYQLTQSKIAVGSGMFTGKGYLAGHPDPPELPARAPHRLHLRGHRRGAGLHGGAPAPRPVRASSSGGRSASPACRATCTAP